MRGLQGALDARVQSHQFQLPQRQALEQLAAPSATKLLSSRFKRQEEGSSLLSRDFGDAASALPESSTTVQQLIESLSRQRMGVLEGSRYAEAKQLPCEASTVETQAANEQQSGRLAFLRIRDAANCTIKSLLSQP